MTLTDGTQRLIVTRPIGQAEALIHGIHAINPSLQVVHQPLMDIASITDDSYAAELRHTLLNIDQYQAVIAISKNAADIGLQWLDKYWPQPPLGIDWYGVGPTTADQLKRVLHPVYLPSLSFDSEGLLALESLQQVQGQKILIWRGIGGRETLARVLRQRGAVVDYAELYQRRQIHYSAKQWQQTLAHQPLLLLSSGQALDIVTQQVDNLAQQVSGILVPSERVAAQARSQGYKQVLVANSARDADVLAQLRHWFNG